MKNKYKILGLINARGGSKRIPRKNIQLLCGKPLIYYSIKSGLDSKLIDRVIVSTDDDEIAEVARKYGAEVPFKRPKELAGDNVTQYPPTRHAILELNKQGWFPDIVVLLTANSPFKTGEDVDKAIKTFIDSNVDCVRTVCKSFTTPFWTYTIKDNLLIPFVKEVKMDDPKYCLSQNLPEVYQLTGMIDVAWTKKILNTKYLYGKKVKPLIFSQLKSMDIDIPLDMVIAETMMRNKVLPSIRIGNRIIGEGYSTFIIAEAGVNHNGSIKIAKKMIDAAKKSGVDAIKFQTIKAELNVMEDTEMADYQKQNTGKSESMFDMLKKLELSEEDFKELKDYCGKDIIFLSTAHSNEWSIDVLERLNVPAHKIPSGDITNIPLLEYAAAKTNKPIILSTGMANLNEIEEAINAIRKFNDKIILLQCTTEYPCPSEHANIKAMQTLKRFGTLVGYSDHTTSIIAPAIAVAQGACLIEKHFTLNRDWEGPDHKASLEPDELKLMVENIRYAEKILGDGIKKPIESEIKVAQLLRKSIVASRDIPFGEKITRDMLIIKRPATGIKPREMKKIIGRYTKRYVYKDELLSFEDLI